MRSLCLLVSLCIYASAYEYGHYVEEGSHCKKRTGELGICKHFNNCESAIHEVRRNGKPEICSFAGIYPIVCCKVKNIPNEESQHTQLNLRGGYYSKPFDEDSISLKKCRKYHSTNSQNNLIYDGSGPNAQIYPHLALIGVNLADDVQWKCTGSLISEKFVLTSASCLRENSPNYVRLGSRNLYSHDSDGESQSFRIKHTHIHPDYNYAVRRNNIALIELDRTVEITPYVSPACLAITEELTGTLLEAPGWKSDPSGTSYTFKSHYYTYISNEHCSNLHRSKTSNMLEDINKSTEICTRITDENDVHHNELGGALQIRNFYYDFNIFPEIVGVPSVSRGPRIDSFTRVYAFIPWIEKIVWAEY